MRKIGTVVLCILVLTQVAGAVLLVEESWDYEIGSDSSSWTGGVGFASAAWDPSSSGTVLGDGLAFGDLKVSGGAAHIQHTAGSGFSAPSLGRTLFTSSVSYGNLWMAYLFRFDTTHSTIPSDEKLEVRLGAGDLRTGIDENQSATYLRYGADTTVSATDSNVKGGSTMLYVVKFSDMGSATGSDAQGWVMTLSEFESMMGNGGVSEENLTDYAGLMLTNSFAPDTILAGNVTLAIVPVGRNGSSPSFYMDELRVGFYVEDVVPTP